MGPRSKVIRTELGKVCTDPNCECSGSIQPWHKFHKKSDNKDGCYNFCKVCRNRRKAAQELTKKPRVKAIKTSDGKSCTKKDCKYGNTIQPFSNFNKRLKDYRPECKDCQSKARSDYYEKMKKEDPNKYTKRNKSSYLGKLRRLRTDGRYRLDKNIGKIICKDLKGMKAGKTWKKFLPYTVEDLIEHLSSQFYLHPITLEQMTMVNYGSAWHVDHIIPRSSFSYESELDQAFQDCWSLANLQPLWQEANIAKSAKSPEEWAKTSAEYMWTKEIWGNSKPSIKEDSHAGPSILS